MKFLRNTLIILLVLAGLAWFAVSPSSQISSSERIAQAESQDVTAIVEQMVTNVQLTDQGLTSKVELNQATFDSLLKASFEGEGNSELLGGSYQLEAGKIRARIPYRLFGLVQSQLEMGLRLSLKEQAVQVEVASATLGRIPLPGALIEQILAEQARADSSLNVSGKTVELPLAMEAFLLQNLQVEEGRLVLDLQINQNRLLAALNNQAA